MLLVATGETKKELLRPSKDAKPGERVFVEGHEIPEELQPVLTNSMYKKKLDAKILGWLGIDSEGRFTYDGHLLRTKSGYITVPTVKNGKVS